MSVISTADAVSVAEYAARITRALRAVGPGVVEGEVQKPVVSSGMLWFGLTDGRAKLACKVFRSQVAGLEHKPRHGDLVQVQIDRPDLWAEGGKLDVIVSEIRLAGEGELLRRREELLARLSAEGLCDPERRRPLPTFPRAVGVIAGRASEGMKDVVEALHARFPAVHIVTCAAVVQGARAPLDLIDALAHVDAHPLVDVIVIARGGGSVQDLLAFDDERLCRAVFACPTPVIAAIGHTGNVPVCNHVAWSAETPSRAPELAVPSVVELRHTLGLVDARLAPVPGRVRALRDATQSLRVDATALLRARRLDVTATVGELRIAEHAFFSARETGLARAREILAAVPGRIPEVADVDAVAGRLDTLAVRFFSERSDAVRGAADFDAAIRDALREYIEAVRDAAPTARAALETLQHRMSDIARAAPEAPRLQALLGARTTTTLELGTRVRAGIRKELTDHVHDYGRALRRHVSAARDATLRRLTAEQGRVVDLSDDLKLAGRRCIADAQRNHEHITALLAASDPRRRGWVLPTRARGGVVRSASELVIGEQVTLSFHDGAAGAVINTVPNKETE